MTLFDRLREEPALIASAVVAAVGLLVTLGVLDPVVADSVQAVVLAVVALVLGVTVRAQVVPSARAERVASELDVIADPAD